MKDITKINAIQNSLFDPIGEEEKFNLKLQNEEIEKTNLDPELSTICNFEVHSLTTSKIEEEIRSCAEELISEKTDNKLIKLLSANSCIEMAKKQPIPKMLFSEFWYEGEFSILFADTNVGKSLLAVQIANNITKGETIEGFKLEAKKQGVLYYDFEMSNKQFELRYSNNYTDHFVFDETFLRGGFNSLAEINSNQTIEKLVLEAIEEGIKETNYKIVIIDNITYINENNEKASEASPLMKGLKSLKDRYGLSLLILAHTPKRNLSKPLDINDVQGSKMMVNYLDSCFGIGKCANDSERRYIKQIKQRNTREVYGSENVCICKINGSDNFLRFEFIEYGSEYQLLKHETAEDKIFINEKVLKFQKEGMTQRQIAKILKIDPMRVNRIILKAKKDNDKE